MVQRSMPMPRCHDSRAADATAPSCVEDIIADVLHPRHFCVRGLILEWAPPAHEEISWEVYRGRLLDPAQTRERGRFVSWHVFQMDDGARSPEPLLSVKLDKAAGAVHVVRALPCY